MKILIRWLITTLTVFALPYFIEGIAVDGILTAVIVAVCLVFIHMVIKPIIGLLTLPLNIITLGLFAVVLNGLFFWFVASVISGIAVATFTAALIGALIISFVNWIVGRFTKDRD